jgi:DNA-binding winged helix-turn-helix (wHTH) protein
VKPILYRFGPFVLNPAERVLRRNGVLVPLAPKVFSTLHVLVAGGGRVISKEDLLSAVWPDSFVEDGNLTQNISVLRKILADDFAGRSPIETIARIGYRFCPGVETEDTPESAAPLSLDDGELRASEPPAIDERRSPNEVPAIAGLPPQRRRTDLAVPLLAPKTGNTPGRWSWILLCALALLGIGIEVRGALHARSSAQDANDFTLTRLTTKASEDAVTAAAISPNGRWVAYADADGVVLQTIGDSGTHTVRAPAMQKADTLAWFPDGLHLLLSGEEPSGKPALWVLSVTEDAPLLLREGARLGVPAPDGSAVAFTTEDKSEIWTASTVGENPRRLIAGSPGNTFGAIAWSKNSRTLLLNRHTATPAEAHPAPDSDEALHGFHSTYLAADASTGVVTATVDGIRFDDACLPQDDQMIFARSDRTDEYEGPHRSGKSK